MTIGQWLGTWVGSWLGSGDPAPEGTLRGTATISLSGSAVVGGLGKVSGVAAVSVAASGSVSGGSTPVDCDSWGGAWGSSWGDSWGRQWNIEAVYDEPVSVGGASPHGEDYEVTPYFIADDRDLEDFVLIFCAANNLFNGLKR